MHPGPGPAHLTPASRPSCAHVHRCTHRTHTRGRYTANRLRKNLKHLRRWVARGHPLPLAHDADSLNTLSLPTCTRTGPDVQEYAPPLSLLTSGPAADSRRPWPWCPRSRPPTGARDTQGAASAAGPAQYQKLREEGRMLKVREGGLLFLVNFMGLSRYWPVLDHRLTRRLIRALAPGRRFSTSSRTLDRRRCTRRPGAPLDHHCRPLPTYLDWLALRN